MDLTTDQAAARAVLRLMPELRLRLAPIPERVAPQVIAAGSAEAAAAVILAEIKRVHAQFEADLPGLLRGDGD
jgi:FAD/FMN-containing dehydrogenase